MSTPDQKPRGDGLSASQPDGGRFPEEADLALGETVAGLPARGGAKASKPEVTTLPEKLKRPSGALPKHIEETLSQEPAKVAPAKVIADELPRGASLGRYIVLSCLGAGGMGVVYAAYDPELDRKVAIKLLRTDVRGTEGADAGQARLRLLREAQAMARLQNPQVIAVYDVGTIKDQVFIAMEFIDGTTLTHWIKEHPRSFRQIVDVFTLAGRGLAAAHAVGLVHRDFKPDNVLVGKDGQVRVTDFGLARSVDQSDEYGQIIPDAPDTPPNQHLSVQLTRTGALMGTPRYMAPEQYSGAKTDPRTDQFSFCVALYESVYGVVPFAGDNIATLGFNVLHGRVLSAPADARVPTWMRQVLLRGLSVSPDDRFPSMEALLAALQRDRAASPRLWLAAVGVVVLALLGNLASQLHRGGSDPPCSGQEKLLDGKWDEASKQNLKKQLLATGKPYAADAWERVEQSLDAYTESWVKMRTTACLAMVRGEQTPYEFDLRRRCLDEDLQQVSALTSILAKGDDGVAENASTAVHDLPPLSLCADVDALRAPPPMPDNPAERQAVEKINEQLAAVRAEQSFDRYGAVIERAQALVDQASRLKYVPLKAESLYLLGQLQENGGMARQAEKTFVNTVVAAMESHNQRLVAQTWIDLTSLTGTRLGQPEKAESWEMLAGAALKTLTASEAQPLLAQLLLARCGEKTSQRAYDSAIESCQQALTLSSNLHGNSSPEVAEVLHTMGRIYRRMDQFDQAMRYHQEALEVEKKRLGSLHPSIASELRGIGILLRDQRRYHESQDYMQKALSLVQKSLGPDHIRTSDFYLLVGINLMYMNRPADAYREFQRCYDIRKQVSEKAAEHEYERRAEAAYFLGLALTRLGRYSEALAVNQEGLKLAEKDLDFKPAREAYNLHAIGVILFALGHSSEAAPYLERALSIRQNQRDEERRENLNHLAETQFGLAQVLWSLGGMAERQRAVELARAAQTNYTEWGNKPENELGAVTAWLAAGLNKPTEVAALGLYEGAVPAAKDGSGGTPLSP